jgi:hypothetical protein
MAFSDIIRNWDNENKLFYVQKLIENLRDNKEGYLTIKMLAKIFRDFTGSPAKQPEQPLAEEAM